MIHRITLALLLSVAAGPILSATAYADGPTCKAQSTDKKLAGAAATSFMGKCTRDATAACDATAADKKLAGAAKTSFTKKCIADATG